MELDFGYGGENNNIDVTPTEENNKEDKTDIDTGKLQNVDNNDEDISDVNNNPDDLNDELNNPKENHKNNDEENKDNDTIDLEEGTELDVEGKKYTVDKDKNIIDENGNIFKEANEAKKWLDSFNTINDDDSDFNIDKLKEIVGIDITGENNEPVEYENNIEGIASYVKDVIENSKTEHFEAAINTLTNKFPFLNGIINYYIANGNSLEGYGEVKDRSNIVIDENNEAQQENIIRIAWEEQGRKGDVSSYIDYLKNSGTLLETAKEELEGLVAADEEYKKSIEEEAERKEEENYQALVNYWKGTKEVIDSGNIAGYKIPDSIIINRNGAKMSVTRDDFFKYIYEVDNDGISAYERDLMQETPESRRDDEILRAYLKFVGGDYSNLVDMAINKKQVEKLKLRAKSKSNNAIRISKPKQSKNKEIDLGFN